MSNLFFLSAILLLAQTLVAGKIVFPNINVVPTKLVSEPESFIKAIKSMNNAAVRLLDLTKEEATSNWMVSPVSLAAILGELMLGARGDFSRVLGEILSPGMNGSEHFPGIDVHKEIGQLLNILQDDAGSHYLLYITSALFIHPEIPLKLSYKHAIEDIYHVDVIKANFSGAPEISMEQINAWVDKITYGRINSILPHPVSPTTASLYVSTVYFKGVWKQVFDPLLTKTGIFSINSTHQVPVEFITGEQEVKFGISRANKCTVVGIPYEGSQIFFYVFLPEKDPLGKHYQLTDFATQMTLIKMNEMILNSELENITIALPKMKISSSMSLRNSLVQAIKLRKLKTIDKNSLRKTREVEETDDFGTFLSNSYTAKPLPLHIESSQDKYTITFNMGSASDDFRFKINDVMHKVQLDIDENGSEAIAVSSTLVDYMGIQVVRVNRPFLFLIRHEGTGANLFWGAIYSPE